MANTKAVKKRAKKLLGQAEEYVAKARKAVRKSGKKLRKEAASLSRDTQKLAAKHAKAVQNLAVEKAAAKKAVQLPSVAPSAVQNRVSAVSARTKAAAVVPRLPEPRLSSSTVIELREQAKSQKIPGYARLNKAALIAALDQKTSTG